MRSTTLLSLIFTALTAVPMLAHADWHTDNRTYRGGNGGGSVGQTAPAPVFHQPEFHQPIFRQPAYQAPYSRGSAYYRPFRPVYPVYHHEAPNVYWRTGHWAHSWHDNRFGWWWVNGLGWSFYSAPVYPYPEPIQTQTTIIYEPQPAPVMSAPAVASAPPATAPAFVPGDQAPPQGSNTYYFCESSQLYYPYARSCSERWKLVPQAPVD